MKEPRYDHLSLLRYKSNGESKVLLVTQREMAGKEWFYTGRVLDTTDSDNPKFTGFLSDIPERDLFDLPLEKRVKKISTRILNMNPAVSE